MASFPNPIALQLYTLRDLCAQDFPGTLQTVAEIGYQAVEVAGLYGMSPAQVKAELDRVSIRACSSHVPLAEFEANPEQTVAAYAELGCHYLVVPWIDAAERTSLADWDRLADRLDVLGDACNAAGLTLAYHNHAFEFEPVGGTPTASETGWSRLFPAVGRKPKYVGEIDVFWVRYAGHDPARFIASQPVPTPLLHVKDMAPGPERAFAEVGEGILEWAPILKEATARGTEWLIVEQDQCTVQPPLESVALSLRNLRGMLAQGA